MSGSAIRYLTLHSTLLVLLWATILIIPIAHLYSYEGEDAHTIEGEWQTLEWTNESDDGVLFYEVVVEKAEKKGGYTQCVTMRSPSGEHSVQMNPLLPAGKYRYKVITYNFLKLPSSQSAWQTFTIIKARQPVIRNVSLVDSGGSIVYLEEPANNTITLNGRNLFPPDSDDDTKHTSYAMIRTDTGEEVPMAITEADMDGGHIKVQLDMDKLDAGTYRIIATDISGLVTNEDSGIITVKLGRPFDIYVSAGWICPIFIIDDTFPEYLGSKVYPLSAGLRAALIPFKHTWGNLGFGLNGTYTRMNYSADGYTLDGNMMCAFGTVVYKKPLFLHRAAFEARVGGGLVFLSNYTFHFDSGYDTPPLNGSFPAFTIGGAFQYTLLRKLYAEAGVDYIMSFMSDITIGFASPNISIGWRF